MASSGYQYSWGNGQDTDDNSQDFLLKDTSEPQNSQSSIEVYPTVADDGATHAVDGVMSKTAPTGNTVSSAISGGEDGTVLWWYSEYPALCDMAFGENNWTAHICYDNTAEGSEAGTLTTEVFKVASADGTTTCLASGSAAISAGASDSADITFANDSAKTVPKGDRFAIRISWNKSTAINIKFNSSGDSDSYLSSPTSDPGWPTPEPATIILVSIGLAVLVSIFAFSRLKKKKAID